MLSSSKLLAVALLIAVAATGFVSGHAAAGRDTRACEGSRERGGFAGMLQDSLRLSDAQRDTVRAILVKHRPEMRALTDRIRPQVDSLRLRVNDEIAASLTPAQQQHFAQMREHWRVERARHDSAAATAQGRR